MNKNFSIEASNVTEKLVSDVHNAGKEIYAWTVNTEENINRMIENTKDKGNWRRQAGSLVPYPCGEMAIRFCGKYVNENKKFR